MSKSFFVGWVASGEAVRVVPCENGEPTDLQNVRTITAQNRDEAARKYIELTTGGRAAMRGKGSRS